LPAEPGNRACRYSRYTDAPVLKGTETVAHLRYVHAIPDPLPNQDKFAFKVFCQLESGQKRNLVLSADTERERLDCMKHLQQLMAGPGFVSHH
jgi:hypothetical protein